MDFLSIIGTAASVGSIPLSVYFFIKSKENKIDKVKREIVRVLSHQIGERRQLTIFEIQTVINSKAREAKIDKDKIAPDFVIEDLVAETISNPLLEKGVKEVIIEELKNIYFKGEIFTEIDSLEEGTRDVYHEKSVDSKFDASIRKLVELRKKMEKDFHKNVYNRAKSEIFAFVAFLATILGTLLTITGKDQYDHFFKPLYEFLQQNDFYIGLLASFVVAIIAAILSWIIIRLRKKP